jgi:hypothetical protein
MLKRLLTGLIVVLALTATWAQTLAANPKQSSTQQKISYARRSNRFPAMLATEVRHRLVMLPSHDVFDWLEGRPGDHHDGSAEPVAWASYGDKKGRHNRRVAVRQGLCVGTLIDLFRQSRNDTVRDCLRDFF